MNLHFLKIVKNSWLNNVPLKIKIDKKIDITHLKLFTDGNKPFRIVKGFKEFVLLLLNLNQIVSQCHLILI